MDTCGHVGWQIKNTKETTNPNRKGRNADPPARYALRHPAEKQSKKRTGQGPTKTTTTKICQGHSDEKPLCRNSQKDALNELVAAQRVKHASKLLLLTDNKALAAHHCILASQSPLTSSCSGVWFKTKCVCREPNGGFRSRKSKFLAANLQLYRPPYGEQLRGSG